MPKIKPTNQFSQTINNQESSQINKNSRKTQKLHHTDASKRRIKTERAVKTT